MLIAIAIFLVYQFQWKIKLFSTFLFTAVPLAAHCIHVLDHLVDLNQEEISRHVNVCI